MSNSRIPSPARSQGVIMTPRKYTPRKYTPRRSRSVCSAKSNISTRLTSIITESFKLSPVPSRRSILPDDTDIEEPRRQSWWKKLGDNSRDMMEVLDNRDIEEIQNIAEEFDVEIFSQEKKNYTLDLPESSDGESIRSIVIPQRKLFSEKENRTQKKFGYIMNNRDTLDKLQKSHFDQDKEINTGRKTLFNQDPKRRTKPVFPTALLDISSKAVNKTKEMPKNVQSQVRNLFGNQGGKKRKNMFADFILSESEDEIPEIQANVFGFNKDGRNCQEGTRGTAHSPTSSIDLELDDWKHLPSSTMVEHQLEEAATPVKHARLSKLSEVRDSETTNINSSINKTKQSSKSKISSSSKLKNAEINKSNYSQRIEENIENNQSLNSSSNARVTRNKSKSLQESSFKEANNSKAINKSKKSLQSKTNKEKSLVHETDENKKEKITAEVEREVELPNTSEQIPSDDDGENFTLEYENDDEQIDQAVEKDIDATSKEHNNEVNQNNSDVQNKSLNTHHIHNKTKENNEFVHGNGIDENDFNGHQRKSIGSECYNSEGINQSHIIEKPTNQNLSSIKADIKNNSRLNNDGKMRNHSHRETQNESLRKGDDSKHLNDELGNVIGKVADEEQNENDTGEINAKNCVELNVIEGEGQFVEEDEKRNESADEEQNKAEIEELNVEEGVEQNESEDEEENVNEDEEENVNDDEEHNESEDVEQNLEEDEEQIESENEEENEEDDEEHSELNNEVSVEADNHVDEENRTSDVNQDDTEDDQDEFENADQVQSDTEVEDDQVEEEIETDNNVSNEIEENETEQQENEDSDDRHDGQISQNEDEQEPMESDNEQSDDNFGKDEIPESENYESSQDTTGRRRNKEQIDKSPEAVLCCHTKRKDSEFEISRAENNTSIKNINIQPSLAPARDSVGLLDNIDSSAEGSGWDSHRTTRKTLRKTFGKDFTIRKSLRALVMEKSAKQYNNFNELADTNVDDTKVPQANSTELPAFDSYQEEGLQVNETAESSDHEVSARTRQTTLEAYMRKVKQENIEKKRKLEEEIRNSFKQPPTNTFNSFKFPQKPAKRLKPTQTNTKTNRIKPVIPLDMLPKEVLEDLKYKPPKRFQPRNASWVTKRLYKFLEIKLEAKYDYMARVRAERFVKDLYAFTVEVRRGRSEYAVDEMKREMARLNIVKTHHEFYNFFHDFLPREIRIKVIPDIVNDLPLPKQGVFSDILQ